MHWEINLAGIALIALVVWWFWLSKPKPRRTEAGLPIEVVVENGVYTPSVIETPAGKPVRLRFLRKDPSPCAEKVLFDALGVSADLPIDKPVELTVQPPAPGEYEFTCQMRMYRGTLVAR
jgi:plastocyanin domain-containing protein